MARKHQTYRPNNNHLPNSLAANSHSRWTSTRDHGQIDLIPAITPPPRLVASHEFVLGWLHLALDATGSSAAAVLGTGITVGILLDLLSLSFWFLFDAWFAPDPGFGLDRWVDPP